MGLKKLIEIEQRKMKVFFKNDTQVNLDKYDEIYIDVANTNLVKYPKNDMTRYYMTLKEVNTQYIFYKCKQSEVDNADN